MSGECYGGVKDEITEKKDDRKVMRGRRVRRSTCSFREQGYQVSVDHDTPPLYFAI